MKGLASPEQKGASTRIRTFEALGGRSCSSTHHGRASVFGGPATHSHPRAEPGCSAAMTATKPNRYLLLRILIETIAPS